MNIVVPQRGQVLNWCQLRLVVAAEVALLLWLGHQAAAAAAAAVLVCALCAECGLSCHRSEFCVLPCRHVSTGQGRTSHFCCFYRILPRHGNATRGSKHHYVLPCLNNSSAPLQVAGKFDAW
jgi:hypothetical protein